MKLTITSIELKNPLKFFALANYARHIIDQLKKSECKDYKAQGFWTKHYTMSLWDNEEQLKAFARSGAHLEGMKKSASISKQIRTLTIDSDKVLDWKTAKARLEKEGKTIDF